MKWLKSAHYGLRNVPFTKSPHGGNFHPPISVYNILRCFEMQDYAETFHLAVNDSLNITLEFGHVIPEIVARNSRLKLTGMLKNISAMLESAGIQGSRMFDCDISRKTPISRDSNERLGTDFTRPICTIGNTQSTGFVY